MASPKKPSFVAIPEKKAPVVRRRGLLQRLSMIELKRNNEEREYIVENLSMLMDAGVTITAALAALEEEITSSRLKWAIGTMREEIDEGSSFWRALEKTNMFSRAVVALVKIGEEVGRLPENLKVVALQQRKEENIRSKVRSAMIYPLLVVSLTIVVGLGVAWFVLPRIATSLSYFRVELPAITRWLVVFGNFLKLYGAWAVPSFLIALLLCVYFFFFFERTKFIGQSVLFWLPGVKQLMQQVEIAKFGFIFGTLLDAGLSITEAADSLTSATGTKRYKQFYTYMKTMIDEGEAFQKIFAQYPSSKKLVPASVQQMIVMSEQSGKLSVTLLKVGEVYEEKTDNSAKNLMVVLEPILLIFIAVGVLLMALAVLLPIYSLMRGIR